MPCGRSWSSGRGRATRPSAAAPGTALTLNEGHGARRPKPRSTSKCSIRRWRALAERDPDQARLVELRYFGGLTIEETAEVLGVSPATVKRSWMVARAWLKKELRRRA